MIQKGIALPGVVSKLVHLSLFCWANFISCWKECYRGPVINSHSLLKSSSPDPTARVGDMYLANPMIMTFTFFQEKSNYYYVTQTFVHVKNTHANLWRQKVNGTSICQFPKLLERIRMSSTSSWLGQVANNSEIHGGEKVRHRSIDQGSFDRFA